MAGLRWMIGSVAVTRVLEQYMKFPADQFFTSASPGAIAAHSEWLEPWALDARGRVIVSVHALCMEADGRRIIVDTCVGQQSMPEMYARLTDDGAFLRALADAGFPRESIDTVICTHLHFDHVGWNTMREDGAWVPTFPNARYLLARAEYEHWRDATVSERAAHSAVTFGDAIEPLFGHGVVSLVRGDHVVTPSVQLVPTPGHSPGHVSIRVRSRGAEAIITGDCIHHPVQLAEPGWYTEVDFDVPQLIASRAALIAECVDRDVVLIGTHFPPPTAGRVVRTAHGVRFVPLT